MLSNDSIGLSEYQWKKVGSLPKMFVPGAKTEISVPVPQQHIETEAEKGYEDGYAKGLEEGKAAAHAQQQSVLALLEQALDETERLRARTAADGLNDIASALQKIFSALFRHELQTSPALIEAMASELGRVLESESVPKVFINGSDYELLAPLLSDNLLDKVGKDSQLPEGVIRASAGNSMLELDVSENLQNVLAAGVSQLETVKDAQDWMAEPNAKQIHEVTEETREHTGIDNEPST